jgi:hypothetical protein
VKARAKTRSTELGVTKPLTIYLGSLLLLLVTALASARAGRVVDMSGFPLDQIPAKLGDWVGRPVQEQASAPPEAGAELDSAQQYRTYRNASGQEVRATLKATCTRIGSMRDYAVATVAEGWTPATRTTWATSLPGVPFEAQILRRVLKKGPGRTYTANWYVASDGRQALTLEDAAIAGWLGRVSGGIVWGQVYLSIGSKQEDPAAEQALTDCASQLLPAFYQVLTDYARQKR